MKHIPKTNDQTFRLPSIKFLCWNIQSLQIAHFSNFISIRAVLKVTQAKEYLDLSGVEGLSAFFLDLKGAKISKNDNNVICTLLKDKHFLFYAQGCGAKIELTMPSWNLNLKWP